MGAIVGQQNQRVDKDFVEPRRILSQFAGEHLGLLVGQWNRIGVDAAILENPLQSVAANFAMVSFDFEVIKRMRTEHGNVVLVRQAAPGGNFKVMKHEIVVWQSLTETLDGMGLAVVFRGANAMNDCHERSTPLHRVPSESVAKFLQSLLHVDQIAFTYRDEPSTRAVQVHNDQQRGSHEEDQD